MEIGALNGPTFKKSEAKVEFADWLSAEELVEHYDKEDTIEADHVIQGRDLYGTVKYDKTGRFSSVIPNHEHIPDVIGC